MPRSPGSVGIGVGVVAALSFTVLTLLPALAEREELTARTRNSSSQTVLGTPNANGCAEAAGRGVADAASLELCTQALRTERLSRQNQGITHVNRAAMLMRMGDGTAALADLDEAAKRLPDNADVQMNRGAALVMAGQPAKAVAALTQALQMNVRNPHMAYYHRAAARERLGDLRGALEDYTAALDINPNWELAEAELARFVRVRRDQVAQALGEESGQGSRP